VVTICKTKFLRQLNFNRDALYGESALTEANMESESDISVSLVATFCDTPNVCGVDYRKR